MRGSDLLSSRFPFFPFLFTNHVSRNEQWNNFQKINETSHLPMPIIQYIFEEFYYNAIYFMVELTRLGLELELKLLLSKA